MHVLIVGMRKNAIEESLTMIHSYVRRLDYGRIEVFIAENFQEAQASLETRQPEVVHFVNEIGMQPLRYSHGCEHLAQALEDLSVKPLVNFRTEEMFGYHRPTFERHRLPPKCGTVAEAVRMRIEENDLYRRAS